MAAANTDKLRKSHSFLQKTLSSGITDSDTTITPNNGTNIPTDTAVTFIIDRVDANGNRTDSARELITGVFNGTAFTNCLRGVDGTTAQSHTAGAVIEFTLAGDMWNDMVDWGLAEHNQDGTHSDITADSITTSSLTISGVSNDGWTTTGGTHSVSSGYNSGNRSFEIATSTDISSFVSEGMRYRVTRDTTPPTQCADLEASSSHYASLASASVSGITFTDDFTCEAWIKPESYTSGYMGGRFSGSSGFRFQQNSNGQIVLIGDNAGNNRYITSYQSVPLNKWIHVAAFLDMSGNTGKIWIDGVEVPSFMTGTATSLVNTGNLQVGAVNGASFYDGKVADFRIWSDQRTVDEIQDNMYAYPSDTTGLVAHFKLNGDFTDASSNGNDLTAQNSAVATDTDNPWNATEYGIITNVTSSTIQVFCPEGYGIPNETLTAPYYSTQSAPYGFPRERGKWTVSFFRTEDAGFVSQSSPSSSTWYNVGDFQLNVPVGSWKVSFTTGVYVNTTTGTSCNINATLSTTTNSVTNHNFYQNTTVQGSSTNRAVINPIYAQSYIDLASSDVYYLNIMSTSSNLASIRVGFGVTHITAECAYI